ncbi:GNAT family N-acetyltransferase [Salininema proteolyticum]|uniref:GNAT family N-acetyltransferase n=1 Tax=Salininema proteolyticum TaxID=1607685 RepID=A0ABV8TYX5_9ACTN
MSLPEDVRLRTAVEADIDAITRISNHYVLNTAANLRLRLFEPEEWRANLEKQGEDFPWLVAERDGRVLGFAYAALWNEREAYAWSVESTVYLDEAARGAGIGRALYSELFDRLAAQGFVTVIAKITRPNDASEGLHRSLGFALTGVLEKIGFKNGQWHDVGVWQKDLAERSVPPPLLRPSEDD